MDEKIFESNLNGSADCSHIRAIKDGRSVIMTKLQLMNALGITDIVNRINADMQRLEKMVNDLANKTVVTSESSYAKMEEEGTVDPVKYYFTYEDD